MSGVTLRPLRPGDEEAAVRWGADDEFCRAIDWPLGLPAARLREHWRGLIAAREPDFLRLGIEVGGALVGYTDLASMDGRSAEDERSAEFGIAIGERTRWNQGLGTVAGRLTLTHAFEGLGLDTVYAEVHLPNARSHALMRRLSFTELGHSGAEEYRGQVVPLVRYRLRRAAFTP